MSVEAVIPGMIDAGKARDIVLLLEAHQRALVSAAVDHRMDLALMVPGHDDWRFADHRCAIVARLRDFDVQTKIIPGTPPENPLLLQLVDFRIGKETLGPTRDAFVGPYENQCPGRGRTRKRCRKHLVILSCLAEFRRSNETTEPSDVIANNHLSEINK